MNRTSIIALGVLSVGSFIQLVGAETYSSHAPVRPLPVAIKGELSQGPKLYVDAARGDDAAAGTEKAPWKTLTHALLRIRAGDTLYLRGGTYYEKIALTHSGTEEKPITIASYPGELAVLDGSLREFTENPAASWEPFAGGAEGEFVSTKIYRDADARRIPMQFLPGSWEPMWGIEAERPLALGHFEDSMLPLHGYRSVTDLRATSEYWVSGKKDKETGIYCGPGLWFNRETGRIHIRLAHHKLEGLGTHAYRGETDPRKLPLIISSGFGDDVLRVTGIKHVKLQGIVLRGATGSPMINVYGSDHVEFDHLTIYGGFPCLLVNASQNIRLQHSAFRGLAAPWTSRAHMKYRGTATYQIVLQNNQPLNENIEIASNEFTDDHDFAYFRPVKNLQFHHNFVDNFNDDGLEVGPKLRSHTMYFYQNRIGAILSPITQHETDKDESPIDHAALSGAFLYRNVFDMRAGTYKSPPNAADPSGEYLHSEGHLAGDHGGPIWSVMHIYHNTFLRETPTFRDNYLFGLGVMGLRNSERDVFNNLFVQVNGAPGVKFVAVKQADKLHEGGNILWSVKEGPALKDDLFAKFRATPLFTESKSQYEPGWTTQDRIVDPQFTSFDLDAKTPPDLRLKPSSPAANSGLAIPAEWPDSLRESDKGLPDIGALPLGLTAWGVGVDGRIPLFGGK